MRVCHLLLFFPFLFSCKKDKKKVVPEIPVQKKVSYHIFAAKDYSTSDLKEATADLRLLIQKINYKTGEITLLWDSSFSTRKLTDYPFYDQKIVVQKAFTVMNSHEKLNGSFSVKYLYSGLVQQTGRGSDAGPGIDSVVVIADL
jgi:hypothetical protein